MLYELFIYRLLDVTDDYLQRLFRLENRNIKNHVNKCKITHGAKQNIHDLHSEICKS